MKTFLLAKCRIDERTSITASFYHLIYTSLKNFSTNAILLLFLSITATTTFCQDVFLGLTSIGGPEGRGTDFSIKSNGSSFSIIKGFADWGKAPWENLLLASDGNYYGMTSAGGTFNNGTIFKMTSKGAVTILHQFKTASDGGYPYGSLIKGSDGNFYGLTSGGGTYSGGTIFKISPTGTYTVLKNLNLTTDGGSPQGHLTLATDGFYYGITQKGGAYSGGTIFKYAPSTGTYTVLSSLQSSTGTYSYGSLMQAADGNFYGMTNKGGTFAGGTIFKITSTGSLTVLRNLNDPTDGRLPLNNNLIQASDGNFYGMITYGGAYGYGTIFKLTTTGTFSVIRHMKGGSDGSYPTGTLLQGSDGYLYGMTSFGGTNNAGVIFKISLNGTTYTILRNLTSSADGAHSKGGFIKGTDGYLYGMAAEGGSGLYGTIFKISQTGAFAVLNSFNGATYGNAPYESLIQGKDNAFYGTNSGGGAYDYGTVFKICGGTITNLHSFNRSSDGARPKGSLVQASDGNLYGMTSDGGGYNAGTIFKITPSGTFTVLRHLNAATDGSFPVGSLIQAQDGLLYGMTNKGGTNSGGTIFKMTTGGTFTVLRNLSPASDGAYPEGDLVQANDGYLYGVNLTRIFKISTTGTFTVLHTMVVNTEGTNLSGSLVIGLDGNFYGTASGGGNFGSGTIFKVTATGSITVLKHLKLDSTGGAPKGSLALGSDGNFYGLTSIGGTYNSGTIFKVTPTGSFTVLRHLNLLPDGGNPYGSLLLQKPNLLVANPQSVTTAEDVAKAITLTGTGGSPLTYTITTAPKNGTLSGSGATRTYTPKANYNGKDSFYFKVSVGCYASATAKVKISVTPVNDTPVLAPIGNKSVIINNTLTFTAKATDVDAGQTLTFSLVGAPSGATINATSGVFSWKPTIVGNYTFKVRVTDNGSPVLYDEEKITVTVTAAAGINSTPITDWQKHQESFLASIYPNPVLDKINIALNHYANYVIVTIEDSRGVVIGIYKYEGLGKNILEMQATQLKPGFYFIRIQTDKGTQLLKFVKS